MTKEKRCDYNKTGIDVSAGTPTEKIGFVQIHKWGGSVEAISVEAEEDAAPTSEFNVELDDRDLFQSEQSLATSDACETLIPDQNEYAEGECLPLEVDISTSGAGNMDISVLVEA